MLSHHDASHRDRNMTGSVNRYSNVIELRERNLPVAEIAHRMECSERTVRRLLEQGERSEQRIVEFESSWRAGEVPRIEEFVPSKGNLTRHEILEELVRVDMEYRWRRPQPAKEAESGTGLPARPCVEDYVKRFTELSPHGQLPASLITEEFRVRTKWGDHPDYSEYQGRFPDRKNSLSQQLDRVHDDLAAELNLDEPEQVAAPTPLMPTAVSPPPGDASPFGSRSGSSGPAGGSPAISGSKPQSPGGGKAGQSAGGGKAGQSPGGGKAGQSPGGSKAARSPSSGETAKSSAALNPTLDLRAAPTTDTTINTKVNKYSTRAEPKKGGMAIVWRAFDSHLNREVAYKELRPDRATDREFMSMFLHEAQVTGQLEHPNIVPVYELGGDTSDDRPYYTMKYVRGGTLTESIDEYQQRRAAGHANRIELHRMLAIFLDVCQAVRYAHSRGVLHRDLKPDNVMVGNYGEVLVVDWGLAKVMGISDTDLPAVQISRSERLFTEVGARKGTPAYWAPEQAEGRSDLVDVRTDIYGLGGILFQILTGKIPHPEFDEDSSQSSRGMETQNPCEVEPSVPSSLAAICVKAMSAQRSHRYSNVDDMVSDVERWRVDEPVSAYRESLSERTIRMLRRNWIATLVTIVGAFVVVLVLSALHFNSEASRKAIVAREIDTLSEFANSQEAKLMARINVLRQDVAFLSTLDELPPVLRDPKPQDAKEMATLTQVFQRFLEQRPEYMQLRLIRKDGQELIRAQRLTPEGKVTVEIENLPEKKDRPYFKQTMQAEKGSWFLSSIELNQENNKKDKNLPVIRGAVPVFATDKTGESSDDMGPSKDSPTPADAPGDADAPKEASESLEGIVIINLHFRKLVSDLRDFEERSASGLVYLTDSEGRFLFHPNKDVAFAFERDLDYRLQHLYAPLDDAYTRGRKQMIEMDANPRVALFVKPDPDFIRDDPGMWDMINTRMATALISIGTRYEGIKSCQGKEGDAILYGASPSELAEIGTELKANLPIKMDAKLIGEKLAGASHAVHYNRLSLEPGNDDRSLGLALVVPQDVLEAGSLGHKQIFWGTLFILALSLTPLVYFIARRTPHTAPNGT